MTHIRMFTCFKTGFKLNLNFDVSGIEPGNKNKGKGHGAGLVWESQSHCFADEFVIYRQLQLSLNNE